jgi:hypothetical protein
MVSRREQHLGVLAHGPYVLGELLVMLLGDGFGLGLRGRLELRHRLLGPLHVGGG